MNPTKQRLFSKLNDCLDKLTQFDIQSIMPLYYVLVAHHEGHILSIISKDKNIFAHTNRYIQPVEACDGFESELLKSIRNSVSPNWFEGESADIVYDFHNQFGDQIKEYYFEIIDYVIDYFARRAGKYSGVVATPKELGSLMAKIVTLLGAKSVFDPCAGLCTYAIQPEMRNIPFAGKEISKITKVIAQIRLDAAEKKADYQLGNCTDNATWNTVGADCLVSEPPFGMRLSTDNLKNTMSLTKLGQYSTIEDFLIAEFITDPKLQTAVLLLSTSRMFDCGNYELRKELVERNLIQAIIALPGGILPYTSVNTYILILDKRKECDYTNFVQAEDCTNSTGKTKTIDVEEVIKRLNTHNSHKVRKEDIVKQNYNLTIDRYVNEIKILPGQHIVYVKDIGEILKPVSQFNETRGAVLQPENMFSDIAEMSSYEVRLTISDIASKRNLRIIEQPCVIFDTRANKFHIKKDCSPLFAPSSYICVAPHMGRCIPEYLAYAVANSKKVEKGMVVKKADLSTTRIAIYESLESQRNIIKRIYREGQLELKKKLEKLQALNNDASDLVHNLGVTFTKMSAAISVLKDNDSNEVMSSLSDNINFALRQINSTGADYSKVKAKLKKTHLVDFINRYLKCWGNYGYQTFNVGLSDTTQLPADIKVEIDENLLFTALDCILINAHQHGFNKQCNEKNSVVINLSLTSYKGEEYAVISVSNNGNPLPDQFGLNDYVKRGSVGLNSFQDGLGGDHICKILKHFDGKVSLVSDSEWVTVSLLIPFFSSDDNIKLNNYECECI